LKKQWVLLYCGLSGSGKSTAAEELKKQIPNLVEINRDEWRFKLFTNGVEDFSKYKFNKSNEAEVSATCDEIFDEAVRMRRPIVISNTNLDKKYHTYWEHKAAKSGYDFEVKYFPITLEEAYKSDLRRGGKAVGRDVLNKQWKQWLKITGRKTYNPTERDRLIKKHVILVDIDGSVAKMQDRGPFERSKVSLDKPRQHVIDLVTLLSNHWGCGIIFLSGRDSVCREQTQQWLENNMPMSVVRKGFELIMRKEGDSRRDSIVKEEFFWQIVKDNYVNLVVDDRNQVIRMWHDLGLTVINVQEDYQEC
jgi:predicted kinase